MASSAEKVFSLLRAAGPQSPDDLMGQLGLSQPTLYRMVKSHPDQALALGGKRNRKVVALRNLKGLGAQLPVFMVDSDGDPQNVGTVIVFHPSGLGFLPENAPSSPRLYSTLPAFLGDARPAGFLGAAFARKYPELDLPPDCQTWNTDDTLYAMARRGIDLPGNILFGEEAFTRFQESRAGDIEVLPEEGLAEAFLRLSRVAPESRELPLLPGSSPKFTAMLDGRHGPRGVVVKYTASQEGESASRARDLLFCEWIALETLRDAGFRTVDTRWHESESTCFLESERVDRNGLHGRHRMLSFSALGALPPGAKGHWATAARQMCGEGKITLEDLQTVQQLECFARMIGHTERRYEKLAFLWLPGDRTATLAPAFGFRPSCLTTSAAWEAGIPIPLCDPHLLRTWKKTLPVALNFWNRLAEEPRTSPALQQVAQRALRTLNGF